jgi:MHS family proline/betaine transporter-like MFS transporter
MLPTAIVMLLSFYPIFFVITRWPSAYTLMAALTWDLLLQVIYISALPAVLANLFPLRTRVTGISLSYNLGVLVFGGFALAIYTWLIEVTHKNAAPSFYLMATALVSIAAVLAIRHRFGDGSGSQGKAKAIT